MYELKAREKFREESLWLQPPEKFNAYHLFSVYGGMRNVDLDDEGGKLVKELAVYNRQSDLHGDKRCDSDFDFRPAFKDIAAHYSAFTTREGWVMGTVYAQGKEQDLLDGLLAEGWRY
jgi:hypothetical protein